MCGKSIFIPLINIRSAAIERLYHKSRLNFRVFHHALAIESFMPRHRERETSESYLEHNRQKTRRVAFSGHFSRVRVKSGRISDTGAVRIQFNRFPCTSPCPLSAVAL